MPNPIDLAKFLGLILLGVLPGCSAMEREEFKQCEANLVGSLKSPSSYKRIKIDSWDDPISVERLQSIYFGSSLLPHQAQLLEDVRGTSVSVRHVALEYDADNSFGAAIRDKRYCTFVISNGNLYAPSAAFRAKFDSHIDNIVKDKQDPLIPNKGTYIPS